MDIALGTDSSDYDLFREAAAQMPLGPYLAIEIGIREGGSLSMLMQSIAQRQEEERNEMYVVGVDRYGGLAQQHSETQSMVLDYTNSMRNRAISSLYQIAEHLKVNWAFYNMDDDDFIDLLDINGVPVFQNGKKTFYTDIAFCHFDGPHHSEMVLNEVVGIEFFAVDGAVFVFDDIPLFDMEPTLKYLAEHGWQELKRGTNKLAMVKRS